MRRIIALQRSTGECRCHYRIPFGARRISVSPEYRLKLDVQSNSFALKKHINEQILLFSCLFHLRYLRLQFLLYGDGNSCATFRSVHPLVKTWRNSIAKPYKRWIVSYVHIPFRLPRYEYQMFRRDRGSKTWKRRDKIWSSWIVSTLLVIPGVFEK